MLNVLGSIPLITQDLCQRLLEWHVFNNHSAIVSTFRVTVDHIHPRLLLSASLVNPWSFLGYLSILLLISLILYWIFIPINDIRDWSHPSQDNISRSHNTPPVFPNGWVPVAESRQVVQGKITSARLHTHELILIRDEDGKVQALDAFCPHLGADLRVGGEIVKEKGSVCVRCPFHGWTFRGKDGVCSRVPYAKDEKPPAGLKVNKWQAFECNGFVCIWFHADGEEPTWYPLLTPEIHGTGEWKYGGRTENLVNCHLQEIPENGADVGHLMAIHSPSAFCGKNFGPISRSSLVGFLLGKHDWSAEWKGPCDENSKHIAHVNIIQSLSLLGINIMSLSLEVRQIGPCLVLLRFVSPQWGVSGVYSQAVMPLARNKQKIVHHIYMSQTLKGRILSRFMLFAEANMVDRDCMMWQNKKFLKNPGLVKEEKSIARFRHWYSQFYSENSPRSFESPLDW